MSKLIRLKTTKVKIVLAASLVMAVMFLAGRNAAAQAENQAIQPFQSTAQMSSASYTLDWDVVASGGSKMSSSSYTMRGTTGQPSLGTKTSSSYKVQSGFWLFDFIRDLFMPLILRG